MNVHVIGGGPAGLYFAILRRKSDPDGSVTVYERNAADDTFGWGVVFSESTLGNLEEADPETFRTIAATFATWDEVHVHHRGEVVRSGGHGFCGIERKRLLNLLQERARELGADLRFETEIQKLPRGDLVVVADGVNSTFREKGAADFRPTVEIGKARYAWLGTTLPLDAFTFFCRENKDGFFTVHAYQFNEELSTFIVETDEASWRAAGLHEANEGATVAYLESLFSGELCGHRLRTNKSEWIRFRRVTNAHWFKDNVVLMGDAARTAHFSIGSGTKLAMEDAICLDLHLRECGDDLARALPRYEEERKWYSEKLQTMAKESRVWFETIKRRRHLDAHQLAYAMMTRNKRLGHDKLWVRDDAYIEDVNRWFAERAGVTADPAPPPMFTPFRIGPLEVCNRVVCSPMCMYSADDGTVGDWHLVHLATRAIGGAGLVIGEMTDVSRDARITPGCAGLYKPEHVGAWKRIVDFVHRWTKAKIGIQIAHAGRKGATKLMWEGIDEPLDQGAWPILAPSPLPYRPHSQVPKPMDRDDMDRVKADFVRATGLARDAGFDLLEVHMAHGYLLGSFLSPLTNRRDDGYGGAIENRMRYPLEVFQAVRDAWAGALSVRLSAIDWKAGGQTIEDTIAVARALKERGLDIVDVSSGHTDVDEEPDYGRCYQVPFSERIRHEAEIPTMTVGAISNHGEANAVLASGEADLVVLARRHLYDPYFTLHAAAEQQHHEQYWPDQYQPAKPEPREKLPWLERERKKRRRLI